MSARHSERLAVESPVEREARLRRTTVRERERLAAETPQDREARLQQMSTWQRERVTEERGFKIECLYHSSTINGQSNRK